MENTPGSPKIQMENIPGSPNYTGHLNRSLMHMNPEGDYSGYPCLMQTTPEGIPNAALDLPYLFSPGSPKIQMENTPGSPNYTGHLNRSLMQMNPEGDYSCYPCLMQTTPEGIPNAAVDLPYLFSEKDRKNQRRRKYPQTESRKYFIPFDNLPILEAGLAEKNLRIYTGESMKLDDDVLRRIFREQRNRLAAEREIYRRHPGFRHGARPPEGKCLICSLEEHTSWDCPYAVEIPTKNAIVSAADIVCKVCDGLFSAGHCCNQVLGRASLKFCENCREFGEHYKQQCPHPPPYHGPLW